jgi:hypothetical protein
MTAGNRFPVASGDHHPLLSWPAADFPGFPVSQDPVG